jgi:hypothetical protein
VGIGGAGGNILKQFLQSQDINITINPFGDPLAYGEVRGLWLESASQDAQGQSYYGSLVQGHDPGYLICHGIVSDSSDTRSYVASVYGFDLKAPGFDRRAEYLKGVFEVFESDPNLKAKCAGEFKGYENPLSGYMWKTGIRPFTIISTGESTVNGNKIEKTNQEGGSGNSSLISSGFRAMPWLSRRNGLTSSKLCDSILFVASLGGGTGTGFINPITSYVRSEEPIFPIFALGILTEKGEDKRHAKEGQRDLGAVIAMYDLLTKESGSGIDGLILVDNQILVERFGGNYSPMDGQIFSAFKPMLDLRNYPGDQLQDDAQAIRRVVWEVDEDNNNSANSLEEKNNANKDRGRKLLPSILVPCYHSQKDSAGDESTLVEGALGKAGRLYPLGDDGRLFPCDPTRADRALVFTRGFFRSSEIMEAIKSQTGLDKNKIKIYRKLGDSKNVDMLILLRNPYGGSPGEHKRQGTLEWRLHDIITESINYVDQNETNILEFQSYKQITKEKLRNYFYGENGLRNELFKCLDRLENGERQVFRRHLGIFGNGAIAATAPAESGAEDKSDLRAMVRAELKEMLRSEECRRKLKELLNKLSY